MIAPPQLDTLTMSVAELTPSGSGRSLSDVARAWTLPRPLQAFVADADTRADRFRTVDVTRGVLIYWMIAAHALYLCGVGPGSWWFYIRPPGWATHGFVMLSGFSLAVALLGRGFTGEHLRFRLGRRAVQLVIVAVASEALSRVLQAALTGFGAGTLLDALALGSADRTWSLSAVLLPTALLFAIAALAAPILRVPRQLGLPLTVLTLALVAYTRGWLPRPAVDPLSMTGPFGLPVLLFTLLGVLGLLIGLLSKRYELRSLAVPMLLVGLMMLALRANRPVPGGMHFVGTFLVTAGIGGLIAQQAWAQPLSAVLSLLGRSALLVFIAHRAVLQFGRLALAPLTGQGVPALLVLLPLSLAMLLAICHVKENRPDLARALHRIGL